MTPSLLGGVGGRRRKGRSKAVERNGAAGNRTLPTAMSVRNLGLSPRVSGSQATLDGGRNCLPSRRGERKSLPSPPSVMSLLSMAVAPEERRAFRRRFRRARKYGVECGPVGEFLGGRIPIRVVASDTGVSRPDCIRLPTCSPNRERSRISWTSSTLWTSS